MVQRGRYSPQAVAGLAQLANLIEYSLLAGIRFDVLSVAGQAVAELDIPNPLSVAALVAHRVLRALTKASHSYWLIAVTKSTWAGSAEPRSVAFVRSELPVK